MKAKILVFLIGMAAATGMTSKLEGREKESGWKTERHRQGRGNLEREQEKRKHERNMEELKNQLRENEKEIRKMKREQEERKKQEERNRRIREEEAGEGQLKININPIPWGLEARPDDDDRNDNTVDDTSPFQTGIGGSGKSLEEPGYDHHKLNAKQIPGKFKETKSRRPNPGMKKFE